MQCIQKKCSTFLFEPCALNSDCCEIVIQDTILNPLGVSHPEIHFLNPLVVRIREILLYFRNKLFN